MPRRSIRKAATPRRALATERTVAVLNFLAAHPGEGFTLSELVAALRVNVSSLHSVLVVLAREGYLVRDAKRKTYRLGPIPVAIGQAALENHPVIQEARARTATLSRDLNLEVLCGILTSNDSVIVAEAGRQDRLQFRPRVGMRLPLMPPLTILGAGYLDEAGLGAWLDRLGPGAGPADRATYRDAALAARRRGYQVELETPTRQQIGMLMFELSREPGSAALGARLIELIVKLGHEEHTLEMVDSGRTYAINNIQAPIFDDRGRCLGGLSILGFDQPLDAAEIERYVQLLVSAAASITRTGGGRPPVDL